METGHFHVVLGEDVDSLISHRENKICLPLDFQFDLELASFFLQEMGNRTSRVGPPIPDAIFPDAFPHDDDFSDEIFRLLRLDSDRLGFATLCLTTNINGLDSEEFLPWGLLAQSLTFLESVQQCLRCGDDFDPVLGLNGILLPCGHVRQNSTVCGARCMRSVPCHCGRDNKAQQGTLGPILRAVQNPTLRFSTVSIHMTRPEDVAAVVRGIAVKGRSVPSWFFTGATSSCIQAFLAATRDHGVSVECIDLAQNGLFQYADIGDFCPDLVSLNVADCMLLTDALRKCKKLLSVNIVGHNTKRTGVRASIDDVLEYGANLTALNLTDNFDLKNEVLIQVASGCPKLHVLNVSGCPVRGSTVICDVADLLPDLQSLNVFCCHGITDKDVATFRAKHPRCLLLGKP